MPLIRVLIVDDSSVIRRTLKTVLLSDPDFNLVGAGCDGKEGVELALKLKPDLVILDVDMPKMNGLEVLAELKKKNPELPIIMFSSLVQKGSLITLDAISLGADDYFCKPSTGSAEETIELLKKDLLPRLKAVFKKNQSSSGVFNLPQAAKKVLKENIKSVTPKILAIGVSAGGPEALKILLTTLPPLPIPAIITQHMPAGFTKSLADHLNTQTKHAVTEAIDGDTLVAGKFLLAPGDYHMVLEPCLAGNKVRLNQNPPENYCRPAVDPMLRSVAKIYGASALTVILTGMGQDGLEGCKVIHKAGGKILVQDQATSVVWGMPGSVYKEGLAEEALSIHDLALAIMTRLNQKQAL
ncbi:MAG: chemotaxis response regulator protein-glutamate methylesterase [Gemmataceae bacterium]|nr:chemotaxis response regulator protein-glutamate methylesterase [Gemmataceae bacterium]